MFITLITILWSIQMLTQHSKCANLDDSYSTTKTSTTEQKVHVEFEPFPPTKSTVKAQRRYWLVHDIMSTKGKARVPRVYEDEKDANLKNKISMLVQQTMHDTETKMKNMEKFKDEHREEAPYRAGFILSMVKKSKDVLDELFNVAVKHRHEWMALEQLKIFELIVHTNVDTTNLLRQLVDVHVKHMNATYSDKKIVILI